MTLLEQAMELYSRGDPAEALRVAENGLAFEPQHEARLCEIAAASAFSLNDHARAERYWERAIALEPEIAGMHYNLGIVLASAGREAEAMQCFSRATELDPRFAEAHSALGACLANAKRGEEAERRLRRALALNPRLADAHFHLGLLLFAAGRHEEAEKCYRSAIALDGGLAEAFNNLGDLLSKSERGEEAEDCFRRAIALDATFADAHFNLGNLLAARGAGDEAEACFRAAISHRPKFVGAYLNLGLLLEKRGRDAEAEQWLRRAIALDPRSSNAHFALGIVLARMGRSDEAEKSYRDAIALDTTRADIFAYLGDLLLEMQRYGDAEPAYRQALALEPARVELLSQAFLVAGYSADWRLRDDDLGRLRSWLSADNAGYLNPFVLLTTAGVDALEQKRQARRYAERSWRADSFGDSLARNPVGPRERLRVGYLSAHFSGHAVGAALVGVLEARHGGGISVHGYSYGPEILDPVGARIEASCEVFRNVRALSDEVAARRIADDQVDILVDLVGYTSHCRPRIAAARPAQIVVNWLGYPGTLGHPRFADYIIGDPVVTPPEHAAHFSETLALMPHCYLPYDARCMPGPRPDRAKAGLQDDQFVFCNFSQLYKLGPESFDVWCRLLQEVPNGVLWMQRPNEIGVANLRQEARRRGVDPERLVFAPRVPSIAEHLGRLQLADLALDSYPYTSHATGCDILRAGVPMISLIGDTFASRVGASLLHAAGIPELVVRSWDDYFALARKLACDSAALSALRRKLFDSGASTPLFDTARFARDLEALYRAIWLHRQNGTPAPFVGGATHPENRG